VYLAIVEIDLETYAKISADIAEGDVPYRDVLALHQITDQAWTDATLYWNRTIGEAAATDPALPIRFSDLFAAAQDAKKKLAPLDVQGWADLVTDVEGVGLARALAKRQLSNADYFRLVRHWAKALGRDAELSRAYAARRG
jgi:hypothetical protein